jgi:hypothetical protein
LSAKGFAKLRLADAKTLSKVVSVVARKANFDVEGKCYRYGAFV